MDKNRVEEIVERKVLSIQKEERNKTRLLRQKYFFTISLLSIIAVTVFFVWAQAQVPNPGHAASQIGAGIFSGDYVIAGNLNVSKNITVQNITIAGRMYGAGLTSCSATDSKVVYNATTGNFSCGADQNSAGTNLNLTGSGCVKIGEVSAPAVAVTAISTIVTPQCFLTLGNGGCSLQLEANESVSTTGLSWARVTRTDGNYWHSLGINTSSSSVNLFRSTGSFDSTPNQVILYTLGGNNQCWLKDDANGSGYMNLTIQSSAYPGTCRLYVCP